MIRLLQLFNFQYRNAEIYYVHKIKDYFVTKIWSLFH